MTEYFRVDWGGGEGGRREKGKGKGDGGRGKMSVCVCVCLCVCLWQRFLRNYWADYNQTSPIIMKSALVVRFVKSWRHHYWWRHTRKNWISYANHEIRRKYYSIFMKISEYLIFSMGLCCIVFGENRNSLSIQNGGPKFAKFAYFS